MWLSTFSRKPLKSVITFAEGKASILEPEKNVAKNARSTNNLQVLVLKEKSIIGDEQLSGLMPDL